MKDKVMYRKDSIKLETREGRERLRERERGKQFECTRKGGWDFDSPCGVEEKHWSEISLSG